MFKLLPSILRTTSKLMAAGSLVLLGSGDDDGLVVWQDGTGNWMMVDRDQTYPWDCVITFGTEALSPYGAAVHGYPAWIGATHCLYREPSVNHYWVVRPLAELGYYVPAAGATFDWWQYNGETPQTATFTKKGTAAADITADIDDWQHWESDTMIGDYSAAGGATGTKTVGEIAGSKQRVYVGEVAIWRT